MVWRPSLPRSPSQRGNGASEGIHACKGAKEAMSGRLSMIRGHAKQMTFASSKTNSARAEVKITVRLLFMLVTF